MFTRSGSYVGQAKALGRHEREAVATKEHEELLSEVPDANEWWTNLNDVRKVHTFRKESR